jgi:hypothetical protein
LLDDVRWYWSAKSLTEIQEIYNSGSGTEDSGIVYASDTAASLQSTNDLGTTEFLEARMYAWVSNSVADTIDYYVSNDGGTTWDAINLEASGLSIEGHSQYIGTTNFTASGSNLVMKLDAVIGSGTNGQITGWGLLCK